MRNWLLIYAALSTAVCAAQSGTVDCDFRPSGGYTQARVRDEYAKAVLRILVKDFSVHPDRNEPVKDRVRQGTGFVVDLDAGMILTAAHVVAWVDRPKNFEIVADHPLLDGTQIHLQIVTPAPYDLDLALLKVTSETDRQHLKNLLSGPLDVALRVPRAESAVTLGYADELRTDPAPYPAPQSIEITRPESDGTYSAKMTVMEGTSGSPVFDANGRVFAVVVNRKDYVVAYLRPFERAWRLFDDVPLAASSVSSVHPLLGDPKRQPALARQMAPYLMSNLQLMRVVEAAYSDRNLRGKLASLRACRDLMPIVVEALVDRDLNPLAGQVVPEAASAVRSEVSLRYGEDLLVSGRFKEGELELLEATTWAQKGNDKQRKERGWLLLAYTALAQKKPEQAAERATEALHLVADGSDKPSAALAYFYRATANTILGDSDKAVDDFQAAFKQKPYWGDLPSASGQADRFKYFKTYDLNDWVTLQPAWSAHLQGNVAQQPLPKLSIQQ